MSNAPTNTPDSEMEEWKRYHCVARANKLSAMLGKVEALITAAKLELLDVYIRSSDGEYSDEDKSRDIQANASVLREYIRGKYPQGLSVSHAREVARVIVMRPMSETVISAILADPVGHGFKIVTRMKEKYLIVTGAPFFDGLSLGRYISDMKKSN